MVWNYTQDFLFGLPDSGKPAAVSVFSTEVQGSGFSLSVSLSSLSGNTCRKKREDKQAQKSSNSEKRCSADLYGEEFHADFLFDKIWE